VLPFACWQFNNIVFVSLGVSVVHLFFVSLGVLGGSNLFLFLLAVNYRRSSAFIGG